MRKFKKQSKRSYSGEHPHREAGAPYLLDMQAVQQVRLRGFLQ